MFVIAHNTLWHKQEEVYIHPFCRLILPCDVLANRKVENERGKKRHGSCGFGLFAAVKRYEEHPEQTICAITLNNTQLLYKEVRDIDNNYCDEIYNMHNLILAAEYISKHCQFIELNDLLKEKAYDTIIYEGGQGLLLDQRNLDNFPHLTPSSVGMYNIANEIKTLNCVPDLYYVSCTYMTRHGAGPMEAECTKEEINSNIIDLVNQPNEWQGSLRFGRINLDTLYSRIKKDAAIYGNKSNINLVFTQLNYTNNQIETVNGRQEIIKPDFCSKLYVSRDKEFIDEVKIKSNNI